MRKHKWTALMLALVLTAGLCVPASAAAEPSLTLSSGVMTVTDANQLTLTADLGYVPADLSKLEVTLDGTPCAEFMTQTDWTGGSSRYITLGEPKAENGAVSIELSTIAYAADFVADLDVAGTHTFAVTDPATGVSVQAGVEWVIYESFHTYDMLQPALAEIQANKKDSVYMDIQSLGKTNQGRDLHFVILSDSKQSVDNYLAGIDERLNDPAGLIQKVESGKAGDYKVAIFVNNIHPDELPGVDAQLEFLKAVTTQDEITYQSKVIDEKGFPTGEAVTETFNVRDVLKNVILLLNLTENPDGRAANTRGNAFGVDLNRDNLYQTQVETQLVPPAIAKWNPVAFLDLHGFGGYITNYLMDPCSPPHNPNFEYDLIAPDSTILAAKFAETGLANTRYTEYEIPLRDYLAAGTPDRWDPMFDDMSPVYTAQYTMLHGVLAQTVEMPEPNQESTDMVKFGLLGYVKYVADHKDALHLNQLEYYRRGVEGIEVPETEAWFVDQDNQPYGEKARPKNENGKFFPEYYVIPAGGAAQRNEKAACDMAAYLLKNGIKVDTLTADTEAGGVSFHQGDYVVSLYQAKKGLANLVLGHGSNISGWDDLYSEAVANFPSLRGFDCAAVTVKDAFAGKTQPLETAPVFETALTGTGDWVVLDNSQNETVKAVNALLQAGKIVERSMTGGADGLQRGDFIVSRADFAAIQKEFGLAAAAIAVKPQTEVLRKSPVLYVEGDSPEVFAYEHQLGFTLTDDPAQADVILSTYSAAPYAGAIQAGTPFIGTGSGALADLKELLPGFDYVTTKDSHESLYKVTYADSILTSGYETDEELYGVGGSWITALPAGASALVTIQDTGDFFVEGWHTGYEASRGQVLAMHDGQGGRHVTVFANTVARKAHQQDEYRLVTNAIYDACAAAPGFLADTAAVDLTGVITGPAQTLSETDTAALLSLLAARPVEAQGEAQAVTRAQFASYLCQVMGLETQAPMGALTAAAYVTGAPDGDLMDGKAITAAEAVVILDRMTGVQNPFDAASAPAWIGAAIGY